MRRTRFRIIKRRSGLLRRPQRRFEARAFRPIDSETFVSQGGGVVSEQRTQARLGDTVAFVGLTRLCDERYLGICNLARAHEYRIGVGPRVGTAGLCSWIKRQEWVTSAG
jgi:hypothetical protein